mmetsp:Transcript_438/g.796  ORF Transcript_438/g.796 Transcript_438/m.796 type:complete len:179 (-) Transcript_438:1319-1855(-)
MENKGGERMVAFDVNEWIKENRELLKPPVGNRMLFDGEFKVMVVGGPNERRDYHVEAGEEWFYQLEGMLTLKVVHNEQFYDIPIPAGSTFCLPARIPHSPQRSAGSVGLVVERKRSKEFDQLDELRWYCDQCQSILYNEQFFCNDLVLDLPPIIKRYRQSLENRTCSNCSWIDHDSAL